jgi:hypothetical protein
MAWRTVHHEGKISSGCWGWGVHVDWRSMVFCTFCYMMYPLVLRDVTWASGILSVHSTHFLLNLYSNSAMYTVYAFLILIWIAMFLRFQVTKYLTALGICDILVRIRMRMRILGSVTLTDRSGYGRPKNIWIRMRILNSGTFTSIFKDKGS